MHLNIACDTICGVFGKNVFVEFNYFLEESIIFIFKEREMGMR